MNSLDLPLVANHLWQSTLFAGVAWLLTLALRNNRARVRHWIWLAASCKFLLPLSALIALGGHIQWRSVPEAAQSNIAIVIDEVSRPFTAPVLPSRQDAPSRSPIPLSDALCTVWALGFLGISGAWWIRWRRIRDAVHAGLPLPLEIPVPAICSPLLVEPAIFGVVRPVLLLPEGIFDRLTPAQLDSIVAHELCHVRHRDNFIAAVHMFVETVFWFHPLVWWVGKRIVAERERACDEEVLRLGSDPRVYAEGILNICKFYFEAPMACVPGVTGSDLKRRIEAIMANQVTRNLSLGTRMLLVASAIAALCGPVGIGFLSVQPGRGQTQAEAAPLTFEAASVKLHSGGISRGRRGETVEPNRLSEFNVYLGRLIELAYGVKRYQVSGPDWVVNVASTDRYDVEATTGKAVSANEIKRMLGPLLAERFHLTFHRETRELPVFGLVVAAGGPKFQPGDGGDSSWTRDADGGWFHKNWSMTMLADWLSGLPSVGRPVIDSTGLQGSYSFHENLLNFPKAGGEESKGDVAARVASPDDSFFSTLQSTLGLKVQTQKARIEILVIDHADKVPTEN